MVQKIINQKTINIDVEVENVIYNEVVEKNKVKIIENLHEVFI